MKKLITLFALVLACALFFVGCGGEEKTDEASSSGVDYSKYSFTDGSWERDAENDAETIRFGADGSFSYYCACGNPVNDSDACEGYTYNDETKTITLNCFDYVEGMVTEIKVVECDGNELKLDFNGEIRVFTKK